jgi:hypothetical protein
MIATSNKTQEGKRMRKTTVFCLLACAFAFSACGNRSDPATTVGEQQPVAEQQPMGTMDTIGAAWGKECKGAEGSKYACCKEKADNCDLGDANCSAAYKACIKAIRASGEPEDPDFPADLFTSEELEELRRVDPGTDQS